MQILNYSILNCRKKEQNTPREIFKKNNSILDYVTFGTKVPNIELEKINLFRKKFNIDQRIEQYCREYLADCEKNAYENFHKVYKTLAKYIKTKPHKAHCYHIDTNAETYIFSQKLANEKKNINLYCASFDKNGELTDSWLGSLRSMD